MFQVAQFFRKFFTSFLRVGIVFSLVSESFNCAFLFKRFPYQIEEIDFYKRRVVIRCRGLRTIVKTSFEEAVYNADLIAGLSPIQACALGGYFGRAFRDQHGDDHKTSHKKASNMSFLLKNNTGKYCISFQDRSGEVGYFDRHTRKEFLQQPLEIVKDSYLISQFDPSQACYLGLLAGLSIEKEIELDKKLGHRAESKKPTQKPHLRLVK